MVPVFYDSFFIGVVCAANITRQGAIDSQEHLDTIKPGATDFQQEILRGRCIVGDADSKPKRRFGETKAKICGIDAGPAIVR